MKKKLTPEEEFSAASDEAFEEDKWKNPEAYKNHALTHWAYITERLELNEAKKKSVSVIGAKGGKKPKINRPILAALARYLSENPKAGELSNTNISKRFCKKLDSSSMDVIVDGQTFEISFYRDGNTDHDLIISRPCERYDGKTANDNEKTIACSTLRVKYIPYLKENILKKKSR